MDEAAVGFDGGAVGFLAVVGVGDAEIGAGGELAVRVAIADVVVGLDGALELVAVEASFGAAVEGFGLGFGGAFEGDLVGGGAAGGEGDGGGEYKAEYESDVVNACSHRVCCGRRPFR